MTMRRIDAADAPTAAGGYAQAVSVEQLTRWLFISGQIPVSGAGEVPSDFGAQCRLAWSNVQAQLRAGGMTVDNLVKVTIFLADRAHADENRRVRTEVLAGHAPALTVIIAGIFDPAWLVEIEAVAAA